ncbi:hypothetical protein BD779DRAFT_1562225 [Infundibulicybe gibba]|nr:hypothetical protein BD779DRAFT_1562225 [Infundibulicybe gibba]
MSQKNLNKPLLSTPGAATLGSGATGSTNLLANLSYATRLITAVGEVAPPPVGSVMKAIGGSAIALICDEGRFVSPLASPRFYASIEKFKTFLESTEKLLHILKRLLNAPGIQGKLVSYSGDIRRIREELQTSQQFEIQRRVGLWISCFCLSSPTLNLDCHQMPSMRIISFSGSSWLYQRR